MTLLRFITLTCLVCMLYISLYVCLVKHSIIWCSVWNTTDTVGKRFGQKHNTVALDGHKDTRAGEGKPPLSQGQVGKFISPRLKALEAVCPPQGHPMRPWPLTPSQYGSSQDVYIKLKDYLLFSYSLNAHGCEKALKWHCIEVVYRTVEDLNHGKCCSAVLNGNVQNSSDQTSVCCQTQSIPRLMLNMSIEVEEREVPLWYFISVITVTTVIHPEHDYTELCILRRSDTVNTFHLAQTCFCLGWLCLGLSELWGKLHNLQIKQECWTWHQSCIHLNKFSGELLQQLSAAQTLLRLYLQGRQGVPCNPWLKHCP